MSQNTARLSWKKPGRGSVSATPASVAPTKNCRPTTQPRRVPSRSTRGDHSGLITQGKYSQLVYSAMAVLSMPRFLYMTTDKVMTTT